MNHLSAIRSQYMDVLRTIGLLCYAEYDKGIQRGDYFVHGLREDSFNFYASLIKNTRLGVHFFPISALADNVSLPFREIGEFEIAGVETMLQLGGKLSDNSTILHKQVEQAHMLRQQLIYLADERCANLRVTDEIVGGYASGMRTLIQLEVLQRAFPDSGISATGAARMSKLRFDDLFKAQRQIGIRFGDSRDKGRNLTLLERNSDGSVQYNAEKLRAYGWETADGCPFRRKPNSNQAQIIKSGEERYSWLTESPLIRIVQEGIPSLVQEHLIEPFNYIRDRAPQLLSYIDPIDRALLSGEIPAHLFEGQVNNSEGNPSFPKR